MTLWDAAAALVEEFDQSPPPPEIHPELVEEGPVDKVMLVRDWRWRENLLLNVPISMLDIHR